MSLPGGSGFDEEEDEARGVWVEVDEEEEAFDEYYAAMEAEDQFLRENLSGQEEISPASRVAEHPRIPNGGIFLGNYPSNDYSRLDSILPIEASTYFLTSAYTPNTQSSPHAKDLVESAAIKVDKIIDPYCGSYSFQYHTSPPFENIDRINRMHFNVLLHGDRGILPQVSHRYTQGLRTPPAIDFYTVNGSVAINLEAYKSFLREELKLEVILDTSTGYKYKYYSIWLYLYIISFLKVIL